LGERLKGLNPVKVFTSPLQRARRTCELAGFSDVADVDPDLVEWNYGEYEGRRTAEARLKRPDWQLFRDGCPGGESPPQVSVRAGRIVARVRAIKGDVLLFSSGHFFPGVSGALDRYRNTTPRGFVYVEHSQPGRFGLRTRLFPVSGSTLERHQSCDPVRLTTDEKPAG